MRRSPCFSPMAQPRPPEYENSVPGHCINTVSLAVYLCDTPAKQPGGVQAKLAQQPGYLAGNGSDRLSRERQATAVTG